jgi:hypothetical protein
MLIGIGIMTKWDVMEKCNCALSQTRAEKILLVILLMTICFSLKTVLSEAGSLIFREDYRVILKMLILLVALNFNSVSTLVFVSAGALWGMLRDGC